MSNNAQAGSSAQGSQPQATPEQQAPMDPRQAEEQARKDRTLTEFMLMLDEYEPMVRELQSTLFFICIFIGQLTMFRYLVKLQISISNVLDLRLRMFDC